MYKSWECPLNLRQNLTSNSPPAEVSRPNKLFPPGSREKLIEKVDGRGRKNKAHVQQNEIEK